jgi:regulatory Fis family protein
MQIDATKTPCWKELYGLVDPIEPGTIKYVGCTDETLTRLRGHLACADNAPVNEWVRWLRAQGREPDLIHFGTVRREVAYELERCLIRQFELTGLNVVGTFKHNMRKWNGDSMTLAETQMVTIKRVLKECGGNKLEASRRLGIGRQTLYNKLKTHTQA